MWELMQGLAEHEGHPAAFTATVDDVATRLAAGPDAVRCWVAEAGGQVVGVALCAVTWSAVSCRPVLRLLNLAVEPSARGEGLGTALVGAVRDAADMSGQPIDFLVREDNLAAQAFYRQVGGVHRREWQVWRIPVQAPPPADDG